MRVIGGRFRGRRLAAPTGRDTRPTADRVREAIFSSVFSIAGELDGALVYDLYAGSGALGIEALSRGAASCIFVESDAKAAGVIARNLRELGLGEPEAKVVRARVEKLASSYLPSMGASLLLADPPYRIDPSEFGQVLEALAAAGALEEGALVVYEHSITVEPQWPPRFVARAQRRYGDTAVSFATFEG